MITSKTLYKVPDCLESFEGIASIPFGVWCTNNLEVRNMTMPDAKKVVITSDVVEGKADALIYGAKDKKIA